MLRVARRCAAHRVWRECRVAKKNDPNELRFPNARLVSMDALRAEVLREMDGPLSRQNVGPHRARCRKKKSQKLLDGSLTF